MEVKKLVHLVRRLAEIGKHDYLTSSEVCRVGGIVQFLRLTRGEGLVRCCGLLREQWLSELPCRLLLQRYWFRERLRTRQLFRLPGAVMHPVRLRQLGNSSWG